MNQDRRLWIILLSLTLIVMGGTVLLEELLKPGPFEWINEHELEDGDEFFWKPLLAMVTVGSFLLLLIQFSQTTFYPRTRIALAARLFQGVYGAALMILSFLFFILIIGGVDGNSMFGWGVLIMVAPLILFIAVAGVLGVLLMLQLTEQAPLRR